MKSLRPKIKFDEHRRMYNILWYQRLLLKSFDKIQRYLLIYRNRFLKSAAVYFGDEPYLVSAYLTVLVILFKKRHSLRITIEFVWIAPNPKWFFKIDITCFGFAFVTRNDFERSFFIWLWIQRHKWSHLWL